MILKEGLKCIYRYNYEDYKEEEFILPSSLEEIQSYAFGACKKLKKIEIPENVRKIGEGAFQIDESLKEVIFKTNSCTISASAFSGCESLEKINLPDNLYKISTCLFDGCKSLKEIILPSKLSDINGSAFAYSGLKKISIPSSITRIGNSAFSDCIFLKEVYFEDTKNVIDINKYIFDNCQNLEKIKFSGEVVELNKTCFRNCHSLKIIVLPLVQQKLDINLFENNPEIYMYQETYDNNKEFAKKYNVHIIDPSIDELLEGSKSFKELNEIYKNSINKNEINEL